MGKRNKRRGCPAVCQSAQFFPSNYRGHPCLKLILAVEYFTIKCVIDYWHKFCIFYNFKEILIFLAHYAFVSLHMDIEFHQNFIRIHGYNTCTVFFLGSWDKRGCKKWLQLFPSLNGPFFQCNFIDHRKRVLEQLRARQSPNMQGSSTKFSSAAYWLTLDPLTPEQ